MRASGGAVALAALVLGAWAGCGDAGDPGPGSSGGLERRFAAAQAAYYRGEHDSAALAFEELRARARASGDVRTEAAATMWLGFAANRRAVYDSARIYGERALELQLEHGLADLLPRAYNALGLLAWEEYRLEDADSLFTRSIAAAEAADMPYAAAVARGNLGLTRLDLGDFDGARRGFRAQLEVSRGLDSVRSAAAAATNLAALSIREGDPLTAVRTLREAIPTFRRLDDPGRLQNAFAQLGEAWADLGEPRLAFAALDTAIAIATRMGSPVEVARDRDALAALHQRSGNLLRALEIYDESRAVRDSLGQTVEAAWNLRNSAAIRARLGDLERARRDASRAAEVHLEAGLRYEQIDDAILLAEIARRRGDRAASVAHLERAAATAREVGGVWPGLRVALVRARFEIEDGDHAAAVRRLEAVEPELASVRNELEAEGYGLLARALALSGDLESAVRVGRKAVGAAERIRSRFGSAELRTTFLHEQLDAYGDLAAALFGLGRVAEGFAVVDAARGRGITAHMAAAPAATGPLASVASRDRLLHRIGELSRELERVGEGDGPAARAIRGELEEAREGYDRALRDARERAGSDAPLLGLEEVRLDEVQRSLGANEALLEYLVAEDRVWIVVVRRREARALSVDVDALELSGRVRVARDLVASPDNGKEALRPVLEGLHELLIAPARRTGLLEGVRTLTVVPHTVLSYLPFAALIDPATGRYLIESASLRYLPSGAAVPVLATRPPAEARSGPTLLAPRPDELPHSVAEVERVGGLLEGARLLVGSRATEPRARRALGESGIVHLATHGVMNPENPMFSRLELAGGRRAVPEDDGRLEIHEVMELEIASRLVFLSGCETGVGSAWATTRGRGEDHATLERAFLYAGAATVVSTLWPIDDRGASALAGEFYAEARVGGNPAASLAAAQRRMIAGGEWAAPYYWAGFRLSGTVRAES